MRGVGWAGQAEAEAAAREAERAEEQRNLRALELEYTERVGRLEASKAAAEEQAHLEARFALVTTSLGRLSSGSSDEAVHT